MMSASIAWRMKLAGVTSGAAARVSFVSVMSDSMSDTTAHGTDTMEYVTRDTDCW